MDRHLTGQPHGLLQAGATMTPLHQENSRGSWGGGGAHPAGARQSSCGPRASGRAAQRPRSVRPAGPRGFLRPFSGKSPWVREWFLTCGTDDQQTQQIHRLHPNSKPLCFKGHRQESENTGNFLGVRWLGLGAFRCQGLGSTPAG